MTTLQEIVSILKEWNDTKTIADCIELAESMLQKERWNLDREYDKGWNDALRSQNK